MNNTCMKKKLTTVKKQINKEELMIKKQKISESTTQYTLANTDFNLSKLNIKIYPNPAQDFIAIQSDMIEDNLEVSLIDSLGKVIQTSEILQGSTLCIMDLSTIYNGIYFVRVANTKDNKTFKIIINK